MIFKKNTWIFNSTISLFFRTLLRNQLIPFNSNISANSTKVFKPAPDNSQTLVVNRAEIQTSHTLTSLQEINSASRKRSAAGIEKDSIK